MTGPSRSVTGRLRLPLLAFVLLAYAHVTLLLDFKDFWWDESLSLQRAEESLGELIRGVLWIQDGFTRVPTIDQHPFFSFLVQGALVRLAGTSEFVVRYGSVMGATLFVPALWVLARWLARRGSLPAAAPLIAVLLGAISPFLLWYGQEARPYALWAALALITTYLALRTTEGERLDRPALIGFVVAELLFVTTHYYAVLLLPLHALIFFVWFARRSLAKALIAAVVLLVLGSLAGLYGAYTMLAQGAGQNFASITLGILVPDLLNAFSLGLSVDLAQVWWIDWVFGALALAAAIWGIRSRAALRQGGWVLPAFLFIPVGLLLVLNEFRPLYMNARHLSMLLGAFVLLVGGGVALIWQWRRWAGAATVVALVVPIAVSTVNYYTLEAYAKDDYTRLGEYMQGRIMPGDAVLYYPPSSWRIFDYYLPMQPVYAAAAAGAPLGVYGVPLLDRSMEDTEAWLRSLGTTYDRIWVIKSGTHPYFDLQGQIEDWLKENMLRVRDAEFFSHSSLRAQLYLPKIPVFEALPADVQHPLTAEFGNLIRLAGYSVEPPATADLPNQVRLYWQVLEKPQQRYKYILQWWEQAPDGATRLLSSLEREPYEGDIPTLYWDPGKTIMEFVEFPPPLQAPDPNARQFYTFQMYDAATLEKLPVTRAEDGAQRSDDVTVRLP